MPPSSQSNVDPPQQQDSNKAASGIANVFRSFRGLNRGGGFSIPPSPAAPLTSNGHRSSLHGEYFGEEAVNSGQALVDKLRANNPVNDRVVAAEALRTIIADYPVSTVTEIWSNAQDLLNEDNSPEVRQAAFKLLSACIKQHEPSSLDRLKIYRTIAYHVCMEDFFHQLQSMIALTNGGRDISTFQKELGGLLSRWLKAWFKEATVTRQARKRAGDGSNPENMSGAEFCLKELFGFTTDVIKFNFKSFEEREVNQLLMDVLSICRRTTHKRDIECSICFIEALITYGYVPRPALKSCIEVLCGAYATLRELADATWSAVSNLCKSYMAHNSVLVLLEILETPAKSPNASSANANTNTLKGAVWFLEKLLIANEQDGLPPVQFAIVMSAFQAALAADSARLELEICRAINAILASKDVVSQISFDEWAVPLNLLVACSRRTTEQVDETPLSTRPGLHEASPPPQGTEHGLSAAISQAIFQVISQLEVACHHPEFEQTDEVIDFFVRVHRHLPNSAAEHVINHYATEHLCYPSCGEWLTNCGHLLDIFFKNRSRPTPMRISVLSLIKDVYETVREVCEEEVLKSLVLSIFDDFQNERDLKVLEALVKMAVDVAGDSNMELFDTCLDFLVDYIGPEEPSMDLGPQGQQGEGKGGAGGVGGGAGNRNSLTRPKLGMSSSYHYGSPVNIVTRGLVRIFIRNMNVDAAKAARTYEAIVKVAGSKTTETDARLTAMKLLFRVRADSENAIYVVETTESDHLAAVFHRITKVPDEVALAVPRAEEDSSSSSSRSNRSSSVSQQTFLFRNPSRPMVDKTDRAKRKPPIWAYPEVKPLPEKPTYEASPILCTFYDPPAEFPALEGPSLDPKTCVRMARWMDQVIIPIIQQGCDWEIYSYVLVHLSSQLANKTAFRNCIAHIKMLRNYICQQLHTDKIPNTDLPEEVKKADIAVALINILTTLVSYKQHFAKNEREGIVKAFQLGLYKWQRTAKPCIHALSICCYELPGSTSKFLPGILTKLSQIITSSAVSVHILEFLLALAKLPTLYSNFTEPDFRNIFGIAFRYIQHTKESTASAPSRASYPGRLGSRDIGNLSDINFLQSTPDTNGPSLPQYVLTLAYNVLTTWFLSLKLVERPKYVSWITRGLVLHDQSNTVDEQSQACIDMLQRFTFSDSDLKPPGKLAKDGGMATKNWLVGGSIISVHMATATGAARLVVRRPVSFYSNLTSRGFFRGWEVLFELGVAVE